MIVQLLHEVCLNVLKNTQNLFLKDERPSYSYLLSYILYLDKNKHATTELICQLHGPIPLCPFNNVLPQILELIDRVTHILYGVNATIESTEECLVAYRECGEKRQSMTRFILALIKMCTLYITVPCLSLVFGCRDHHRNPNIKKKNIL